MRRIEEGIYETLGEGWYEARDNPVAVLRAEARARDDWVEHVLARAAGKRARVLEVGCGAGFLTNRLAAAGHVVTGLDRAPGSLEIARRHDRGGTATYVAGDALALPFGDRSFDVVAAMDFLEHVETPEKAIAEASRVLRPGGLLFFHTFNRNPLSWLIAIKAMRWFVANTPRDLHLYRLFIKPRELRAMLRRQGCRPCAMRGLRPVFLSPALLRLVCTGTVPETLRFRLSRSRLVGYLGYAVKLPAGLSGP
ncbi:MAG: bifunctional 2-polyprenyl-6-hydroxyphenol methylase/3-demethylubiquinol 3-O-methyltransferase UbiG [Oligoflexia bacterium]|nr:bifunctional 2-polyprenyl-6-hydroxyphenol methylase/3-demethylubiquinol 3-O-methyltransferase UbiG [Oligoflexia bacterium]